MDNITISPLENTRIEDLKNFARCIHPQLGNISERISWFSFKNPFFQEKNKLPILLALDHDKKIVGQFMLNNQEWHFQGLAHKGFFGYDFFVDESYRKTGIGALLLIKAIREYQPFFGLGMTEIAEKLYSIAKVKEIGILKKFLWLNRPFAAAKHALSDIFKSNNPLKNKRQKEFPEVLNLKGNSLSFELLPEFSVDSYYPYYEPDVVEFSRCAEFIRWRFFNSDIKYHFYYCKGYSCPLYFVVRPTQRKGLKLLSLVDYKAPIDDGWALSLILKHTKKIAQTMQFDGIITASSHPIFNETLKKEGFFTVGRASTVVSTLPQEKRKIYFTMADADIDLNFGDT